MKNRMWMLGVALIGGCVGGTEGGDVTTASAQTVSTQVIGHNVMNGGGLGVGSYDPATGASWSIQAQENGVGPGRTATLFLNYFVPPRYECDPMNPWYCTYVGYTNLWGQGSISPADLFVAPNTESGQLHTTATFAVTICSDTSPWCTTEQRTYSFDLTLVANNTMHFRRAGTTTFTMGGPLPPPPMGSGAGSANVEVRESGTFEQQGASASGTAFGIAFTNGFGHLQRSTGGQVVRDLVQVIP